MSKAPDSSAARRDADVVAPSTDSDVPGTVLYEPKPRTYLLCVDPDDTAASQLAIQYTKGRLAQRGDHVILLTIVQHPISFHPELASRMDAAAVSAEVKEMRAEILAHLFKESEGFDAGVRVEFEVEFSLGAGVPKVQRIVECADKFHCDLIIVGRRKHPRWLGTGSVSAALLTNTDYSVLVVK